MNRSRRLRGRRARRLTTNQWYVDLPVGLEETELVDHGGSGAPRRTALDAESGHRKDLVGQVRFAGCDVRQQAVCRELRQHCDVAAAHWMGKGGIAINEVVAQVIRGNATRALSERH